MSEEENKNTNEGENLQSKGNGGENIIRVSGMYKEWFLDYASYVILERAVPHIKDGLKPVQRRILHAMNELEDGRFHKVANIIGNTMRYHPHGDAAIGDALVQLGQKELLIDTQGNWGNVATGDRAAAPRYIEARLSKFALDVAFNPKITEWEISYDGRSKEPLTLPMKFPLLLAQGIEGIAVGMACKILPHNFNELISACIATLKDRSFKLFPDFPSGGSADVSNYNDGLRGGKVRLRANIQKEDNKTLVINEIPYGTTTTSLIDSIIRANDKNKIKVKNIEDNTAENVEIQIHLASGISPDKTIDALYAFTDCEISISPNTSVIEDDKPHFKGVTELLKSNAKETLNLLKLELEIQKSELQEKWHFASLERIFIEQRIYRDIEECETWESIIETIRKGLKPYTKYLFREVTDEDIARLTEIKIKRISKFDSNKADDKIAALEDEIVKVKHHLANIVDYTVDYYKVLKKKYGKGRERKTELKSFETIDVSKVVARNKKLYVNAKEGFIGFGIKNEGGEFVSDCSDIDDIIVFHENGTMQVVKIQSKVFVGKNIIHTAVWKRGDKRTTYNMIYKDGKRNYLMMKRFQVKSITREKEYDLANGNKSKVMYFSANPNGEAEIVSVLLKPKSRLRKLKFDIDFSELDIKGRGAKGNIASKHGVSKVKLKEEGTSTLSARKIWFDDTVQRLNTAERGTFLGEFKSDDKILSIFQSGEYILTGFDLTTHFNEDMILIEKFRPERAINVVYWNGEKEQYMAKRFQIESDSINKKISFIPEDTDAHLEVVSTNSSPQIDLDFSIIKGKERPKETIDLKEFIDVKGMKAIGNKLTPYKVKNINLIEPEEEEQESTEDREGDNQADEKEENKKNDDDTQTSLEFSD